MWQMLSGLPTFTWLRESANFLETPLVVLQDAQDHVDLLQGSCDKRCSIVPHPWHMLLQCCSAVPQSHMCMRKQRLIPVLSNLSAMLLTYPSDHFHCNITNKPFLGNLLHLSLLSVSQHWSCSGAGRKEATGRHLKTVLMCLQQA